MGRPAATSDAALAERLREHMRRRAWTGTDAALALGLHKSTISRVLTSEEFSPSVRRRIAVHLQPPESQSVDKLLHKALQILEMSDTLRHDAEMMIAQALDLTRQKE